MPNFKVDFILNYSSLKHFGTQIIQYVYMHIFLYCKKIVLTNVSMSACAPGTFLNTSYYILHKVSKLNFSSILTFSQIFCYSFGILIFEKARFIKFYPFLFVLIIYLQNIVIHFIALTID